MRTGNPVVKARNFLELALYAFLGLGLEVGLIMIEPSLYGAQLNDWTTLNNCMHWVLTCILWGVVAFLLFKSAKKKYQFDVLNCKDKATTLEMTLAILITVVGVIAVNFTWQGFKPIMEFKNLGLIKFIFQYIYYSMEVVLVMLVVVFGQQFGEKLMSRKKIPWGGIVLACTWGMVHILTQDLATGIFSIVMSIMFGVLYLLVKKNIYWAYVLTAIIFII